MAEDKTNSKSKKAMVWTDRHNEILIGEMYLLEPWNYKKGSPQRGQIWEQISDSLNDFEYPQFNVTQKSVRDHYTLLDKQQKRRLHAEEKASGISPEHSETEIAIEDIIHRFISKDNEDQQQESEKKEKSDAETAKAVEMRQSSMETLAESKKRKTENKDEGGKPKRRVSSGSNDTITYLRIKSDMDAELKREEIKLKQTELDQRKAQQDNFMSQQEVLTRTLNNTITTQQRQQEQLMQQMQIQNTALIALMQTITKKINRD